MNLWNIIRDDDDDDSVAPRERVWYCELGIMRWIHGLVTDCCDIVKNLNILPKKAGNLLAVWMTVSLVIHYFIYYAVIKFL